MPTGSWGGSSTWRAAAPEFRRPLVGLALGLLDRPREVMLRRAAERLAGEQPAERRQARARRGLERERDRPGGDPEKQDRGVSRQLVVGHALGLPPHGEP